MRTTSVRRSSTATRRSVSCANETKAKLRERHSPAHYDSKLTTIVSDGLEKVEFAFAMGRHAPASLLIGADGIHSTRCAEIPASYSRRPQPPRHRDGEFLLILQNKDGSDLFVGPQRPFAQLDPAPDVVQSALEAAPAEVLGILRDAAPGVVTAFEDVARVGQNRLVVVDLPPGPHQEGPRTAQQMNAKRLLESERAGRHLVRLLAAMAIALRPRNGWEMGPRKS
ncbi:hypothetical protein F4804DRAFT_338359 [Jackrogersella minutella]|nr:hypothetical protein F4804DRAFT_338359 [Jackrogersella minutella]